jgi:hypothetical protein
VDGEAVVIAGFSNGPYEDEVEAADEVEGADEEGGELGKEVELPPLTAAI